MSMFHEKGDIFPFQTQNSVIYLEDRSFKKRSQRCCCSFCALQLFLFMSVHKYKYVLWKTVTVPIQTWCFWLWSKLLDDETLMVGGKSVGVFSVTNNKLHPYITNYCVKSPNHNPSIHATKYMQRNTSQVLEGLLFLLQRLFINWQR